MRGLIVALALAAAPVSAQEVTVTVETAADGSRTLTHDAVIPAPAAAVWDAVATSAGWQTWAVPAVREGPDGVFETSYDPAAPAGGPGTIEQQWIARTPPRQASFRTTRTPAGFPHADAYRRVVSTFTLTPAGPGATRVRLSGAGYPPGAAGDALIGFFRAGNTMGLKQLHARFTTGPIDWAAAAKGGK